MATMTKQLILILVLLYNDYVISAMYSAMLIHRFSDELKAFKSLKSGGDWPEKGSFEYYRMLVSRDVRKLETKLGGKSPIMFPSEGGQTSDLGNDFGWLHYTWIDIGMPSVSYLVALDTGSDLLWLPCDCLQCAPLSASSKALDKDLHQYSPSGSNTSKQLSCSHQLCDSSANCTNPKQPCPYIVKYLSENVSSSGLLVEDIIHLVSRKEDGSRSYIRTPVIIGCGKKQTGEYLDGIAPDGLMGLGNKEISVPSLLAKAGVVQNSFSLCFNENDSGRIYFGDQGPPNQQTTSLLPLNGKYSTYLTGVEECCIGDSCLNQTSFKALVDCGTSFTHFPNEVYALVVKEFDGQINSSRTRYDSGPWEYCYEGSSRRLSKIPSVVLKFGKNNTFVVRTPVIDVIEDQADLPAFCLAVLPIDSDYGLIGQNYIRGYRMVFDRENLNLGWSPSNCEELDDFGSVPLSPPANSSAPTSVPTGQQHKPGGVAVVPAVPESTPSKSSATTIVLNSRWLYLEKLLFLLLALHQLVCAF